MSDTYNVVLTGELVDGFELDQVKGNMGTLFKLNEEKVNGLFSGKPVVLRRSVDKPKALKLRSAVTKAGAKVAIKIARATATQGTTSQSTESKKTASKKTASKNAKPKAEKSKAVAAPSAGQQPAAKLTCPRCGYEQAHTTSCGSCKMDLHLHLIRLEKKEQMRLFRQQAK